MALTWDDITSKTNKFIVPQLVDNVYKASPVFTRLRTRNAERFEGGTTIRHPIIYAKLRGGPFARGGAFDIGYVQTDTALEVNIKYYYVNATIYGTDNCGQVILANRVARSIGTVTSDLLCAVSQRVERIYVR